MAPPPVSYIRKEPFRGRSELGVTTVAKNEGTALEPPVTALSRTRLPLLQSASFHDLRCYPSQGQE